MTVWLLMIEHEYGNDVSIYATERGAQIALLGYVDEYWEKEIGVDLARPDDGADRVDAYFGYMEDRGESYSLSDLDVKPEPIEIITEAPEIDDLKEN